MSAGWMIYFWTRLDGLLGLSITLSIVLGLGLCFAAHHDEFDDEEDKQNYYRYWRNGFKTFCVALTLALFLPSSKDLAYIVAGTYAVEAVQSDEAKKLLSLATKVLETQLEKASK